MKIVSILILLLFASNIFSQAIVSNSLTDSTSNKEITPQADSIKTKNKLPISSPKKTEKNSSNENEGIIIGTVVGAAAGVGIAAFLGSFSLEPSNTKKASLGELILGGLIGGILGGIVGGLVSK